MSRKSKAEEASEKKIARLRRERDLAVDRYKGLTAFLENLTEDVRQPLNGMMGLVKLLNASGLTPHQSGYLESLSRSVKDLLGHVEDIGDLARLQSGELKLQPRRASIAAIISSVTDILQPIAAERVGDLQTRIDPALEDRFLIDAGRMRQVLFNLTGHALNFAGAGSIRIEARCLSDSRLRTTVMFRIVDTGTGISTVGREALFRRFGVSDGSGDNRAGIALAIARELVGLMGGAMGVQGVADAGGAFWFTLELEKAEPGRRGNIQLSGPRSAERRRTERLANRTHYVQGLKILLAESNHLNRLVIGTLLRKAGHEVIDVASGRAAGNAVREDNFDAVLIDPALPKLTMPGFLRAVQRLPGTRGKIPVIALIDDTEDGRRLIGGGVTDSLLRPVDLETLSAVLHRHTGYTVDVPGINMGQPDSAPVVAPRDPIAKETEPVRKRG